MAKLTKAERRGWAAPKRDGARSFASWTLVFYIAAWVLALLFAAFTSWAMGEELDERRFLSCLEHHTAQYCYMLMETTR